MIPLQCACGTKLHLPDQLAGKQGRCPQCDAVLHIPAAAPVAPPSAPAKAPASKPTIPGPTSSETTTSGETTSRETTSRETTSRETKPSPTASTKSMVIPAGLAPVAEPARPSRGKWSMPVDEPSPAPPPLDQPPALASTAPGAAHNLKFVIAVGGLALVVLLALVWSLFLRRGGEPKRPVARGAGETSVTPSKNHDPKTNLAASQANGSPRRGAGSTRPDRASGPTIKTPSPPDSTGPTESPRVRVAPARPVALPEPMTDVSQGPRSLSGNSQQYDDGRCRIIQSSHGVRIPPSATMIEVNGLRLPVTNLSEMQASPSPVLLLPRGAHGVRFNFGDRLTEVKVAGDFLVTYEQMRGFFGLPGAVQTELLVIRGARAMDVHGAPFLLNFLGADYVRRNQWEAAERKYRRALRVNPTFGPAHLNLAYCLAHRNAKSEAIRELKLAEAFNVGDVYGISTGIFALKVQLEIASIDGEQEQQPVEFLADVYISPEPMTEEDRRIVAFMQAASRYATRDEARAKILNNLAVHFAESGRAALALEYFRGALKALKVSGPERFALAQGVLGHMSAACQEHGLEESKEYDQMKAMVQP